MSDNTRTGRSSEERKGYPAAPAKPVELPKVPKGPAPGSGGAETGEGARPKKAPPPPPLPSGIRPVQHPPAVPPLSHVWIWHSIGGPVVFGSADMAKEYVTALFPEIAWRNESKHTMIFLMNQVSTHVCTITREIIIHDWRDSITREIIIHDWRDS